MSEKLMFRVQFFWTSEQDKDSPPSNIFVKGHTLESAQKTATDYFDQQIIAAGLVGATYRVETKLSTMNEALLYVQQKLGKRQTDRVLN